MTTRVAFLRGPLLALGPPTREESMMISEMPTRLRIATATRRTGVDRVISFAARDPTTALLGGISLVDIDWVQRSARVVARWPDGRGLQEDALSLVLGYATGELALERLVAETTDEVWLGVLLAAGFQGDSLLAVAMASVWPARKPTGNDPGE
ncbi:MAG: hypothetical protein WDA16_02320 [Candidatus Thermoplasmatota archaeon]